MSDVQAPASVERRLRWNPTACTGAGYCAEIAPELISLDDWGFPDVDSRAVDAETLQHARRAVAMCPRLALLIEERPPERSSA